MQSNAYSAPTKALLPLRAAFALAACGTGIDENDPDYAEMVEHKAWNSEISVTGNSGDSNSGDSGIPVTAHSIPLVQKTFSYSTPFVP